MTAVTGRELGTQIAEVLGLDINKVRSITIHLDAASAALVTVEYFLYDHEHAAVAKAFIDYGLVRKDEVEE
jgi:hypothetical protein